MGKIVWQVMQSTIQNRLRLSNLLLLLLLLYFEQQVDTGKNIEHEIIDFSYPLPLDFTLPMRK